MKYLGGQWMGKHMNWLSSCLKNVQILIKISLHGFVEIRYIMKQFAFYELDKYCSIDTKTGILIEKKPL